MASGGNSSCEKRSVRWRQSLTPTAAFAHQSPIGKALCGRSICLVHVVGSIKRAANATLRWDLPCARSGKSGMGVLEVQMVLIFGCLQNHAKHFISSRHTGTTATICKGTGARGSILDDYLANIA